MAYAYLCAACDHLCSRHSLAPDGDLRAGPYVCEDCGCEQPQDGPWKPMAKRQYDQWKAASNA